jgi:hypothetical protein
MENVAMTSSLVYHRGTRATSPFDVAAVQLARSAKLRIACPYLTLDYLRRLIALSSSWRLVSDVEEWLSSVVLKGRGPACDFIIENLACIRHCPNLHGKVLIGSTQAMVGSANFTSSGIQRRIEMAVLIDDHDLHLELSEWFDQTWDRGHSLTPEQIRSLANTLPPPVPGRAPVIFNGQQFAAPLVTLDEDRDIREYLGARGYYIGRRFCVMKGSKATSDVVNAFRKTNNGLYNSVRDDLINRGVLSRSQKWEDYEFTDDFVFDSASAAACVVSGQSRSGPKEWGRP